MNLNQYPFNVSVDVGGVTFKGPGMDTRAEAESIAMMLEEEDGVSNVEVVQQ